MFTIEKTNKTLWDTTTNKLYDISYQLYLIYITDLNYRLLEKKDTKRAAYMSLSDFIKHEDKKPLCDYIEKSKIILRRYKINKIINDYNR